MHKSRRAFARRLFTDAELVLLLFHPERSAAFSASSHSFDSERLLVGLTIDRHRDEIVARVRQVGTPTTTATTSAE